MLTVTTITAIMAAATIRGRDLRSSTETGTAGLADRVRSAVDCCDGVGLKEGEGLGAGDEEGTGVKEGERIGERLGVGEIAGDVISGFAELPNTYPT